MTRISAQKPMHIPLIAFLLLSIFVANSSATEVDEPAATMLVVGRIWTADARRPFAEAVAVHYDKIVAVGSRDELNHFRGKKTQNLEIGRGAWRGKEGSSVGG